jgi:hypothetical protein
MRVFIQQFERYDCDEKQSVTVKPLHVCTMQGIHALQVGRSEVGCWEEPTIWPVLSYPSAWVVTT